ncbi:MAG: hypothetical protein KDB14_16725 [Planctomycetales bacterium]|nr:hypothetical protein [Planctomycetales bacterium]
MPIHDARENPRLIAAMAQLGWNTSLSTFLDEVPAMSSDEKLCIVRQAKLLLGGVYAHLPLKRAGHAVDPVLQLELLQHRLESAPRETPSLLADWSFHAEMLQIFKGLRDVHTKYRLPAPFRNCVAILPFMLEDYFEGDRRRFLVTHVQEGFKHATFKPGVTVTHWNGTPIERAVQLHADREDGSNPAARFAVGLATMTSRPLATQMPPDEEWVIIRYDADEKSGYDILLPWRVWDRTAGPLKAAQASSTEPGLDAAGDDDVGGDLESLASMNDRISEIHESRKHMFAQQAIAAEQRIDRVLPLSAANDSPTTAAELFATAPERLLNNVKKVYRESKKFDRQSESKFPGALQFARYDYDGREFGYLRIRNFRVRQVFDFVVEVMRIVRLLPENGLVIDVRGNGGGIIPNGELLLQLLTPRMIEPAQFQFINTALTAKLCSVPSDSPLVRGDKESAEQFAARKQRAVLVRKARKQLEDDWGHSIRQSNLTGAAFSNGRPLTSPAQANFLGQHYYGPVVLVTDAQCYSTTDIFAAGFQDHEIGPVMGIDDNTGAGGANVWTHHRQLLPYLADDDVGLEPLPRGVSMSVSIRRSMRVGPRFGQPLEDLGVVPDARYRMTRNDLLNGNIDMITHAISLIADKAACRLSATLAALGQQTAARVISRNLNRVDVFFDGRPVCSRDVKDGVNDFAIPFPYSTVKRVEIHGFAVNARAGTFRHVAQLVRPGPLHQASQGSPAMEA